VVHFCPFTKSAGQSNRIQYGHGSVEQIAPGLLNIAKDIEFMALLLLQDHGNHRLGYEIGEALLNLALKLAGRAAAGVDVFEERQRDLAIGSHENRTR